MKLLFRGHEYDVTKEGLLSTVGSLEQSFRDAQYDVPYSTLRQVHIVDSRSKDFQLQKDFLEAAIDKLFEAK